MVAISRAYIKQPDILILDEATSSLDTFMEMKVNAAMKKLMENRTTIMIAHRLSSIKNVDRILYMQDGKIIEDGTLEELLSLKGYYYQIHTQHYGLEKISVDDSTLTNRSVNGSERLWDFNDQAAIKSFKGSVRLTRLHNEFGELEVDLTGCSGFSTKVCHASFPEENYEKVVQNILFDVYVPEKTSRNIKNYFSIHLISSGPDLEWNEIDNRKLIPGWNYFALDIKKNGREYLKNIKDLYFAFNSDEIIDGPVYIANFKVKFKEI